MLLLQTQLLHVNISQLFASGNVECRVAMEHIPQLVEISRQKRLHFYLESISKWYLSPLEVPL